MSAASTREVRSGPHERLARLIEGRFGLAVDPASPALSTALQRFAARHALSPHTALERAEANPALLRELAGHLGVPETYFFRHPELFEELGPFLERRLQDQAQVTVWSVGCCRGEEAYSLAITLDERLGAGWPSRVAIRGCDLSAEALALARAGVYGRWSFRGPASVTQQRAFEALRGEQWKVRDHLRAAVSFEHLSAQELASRLEPASVDVIIFRNVAVYFSADAVQPLYEAFGRALRPGGLLCLATTDPPPAVPGLASTHVAFGVHEKRLTVPAARAVAPSPTRSRRALVPRRAPSPQGPPAPRPLDPRQLADAGRVDEALALLDQPGPSGAPAAARHLLRGQICVGAGRLSEATEALRRVLYLEPGHLLGRYWAALAFARAGSAGLAIRHALELERSLKDQADTATVEDGVTTVGELRLALTELKERLT
ncbi:MAG: CheR family methyltransferase [Archangium sp.]|nr:CheR family methyltransferase [Archangium sp.]